MHSHNFLKISNSWRYLGFILNQGWAESIEWPKTHLISPRSPGVHSASHKMSIEGFPRGKGGRA